MGAAPRLAGKERSRAIVDATLEVFARHGFRGATTRRIAEAAGVSEALVFKHFPTKEKLYRAILLSRIADAERQLPIDDSLEALDDESFLLRVATLTLRRVEEDDTFLRLILHSALEGHELARDIVRARWDKIHTAIERRIRRWHRKHGTRPAVDPSISARSFHGLLLSALLNRHLFHETVYMTPSAEVLSRTLVRIFLEGARASRSAR